MAEPFLFGPEVGAVSRRYVANEWRIACGLRRVVAARATPVEGQEHGGPRAFFSWVWR